MLVLRKTRDIDRARCKPEFVAGMIQDLQWFGFEWQEGPDVGGSFAPYNQSERYSFYREALAKLERGGFIYPCTCSRKDLQSAARAPHAEEDSEPIYPGTCREMRKSQIVNRKYNWRFRVPDGVGRFRPWTAGTSVLQRFVAGKDFGDFVVWRNDDVPAYQLASRGWMTWRCKSRKRCAARTSWWKAPGKRQLLLYRALGFTPPQFYHCAC